MDKFRNQRSQSFVDRCLTEVDNALRAVMAEPKAARPAPVAADNSATLTDREQDLARRLMRVNHAGETAAQALYRGQALVTKDKELRQELLTAAAEEHDHLAWCQQRAEQLGGGVSRLAPLWYSGSFAIGVAAGLAGDKASLGFLAETEKQVTAHLEGHLERLPKNDQTSRAILEQMRADEIQHSEGAMQRGGIDLPDPVKKIMAATSKVMTGVSYRV
jgi:ubiquinone biosynthesis monooxygenase Coq7